MSIHDEEEIEQFLKTQTFYCKLLKARLSHQACLIQSARAYNRKKESEQMLRNAESATWMKQGESTLKLQALLHGLTGTCLRCSKYKKPTKEIDAKIEKRGRKPLTFGRLCYGKKFKGSIPRTPPLT